MAISKYRYWVFSFIVLYIGYHLFTLSTSPLVWCDETFFNAINVDFLTNGTYYQINCPLFIDGEQHLYYGPVFFTINGWIIHFFGNMPFQGRLLGLLAGLAVLFLIAYRYKVEWKQPQGIILILLFCFFLDPFYMASMHKGRNDTLALLFLLTGFFALLKKNNANPWDVKPIISAVLFSLAILTTMRMLVFVLPFVAYFFVQYIQEKKARKALFIQTLLWGAVVFLLFSSWIFYAFGGYVEYLAYYDFLKIHFPAHLIGRLFIPVEEYPLVGVSLMVLVFAAIRFKHLLMTPFYIFCLVYLVTFYLIVGDVGPYSILVVPIYYLMLLELSRLFHIQQPTLLVWYKRIVWVLVVVNVSLFALKATVILGNKTARDYDKVAAFVATHIPAGSRVIGDDMYYYAVLQHKCTFQYMHLHVPDINKIEKYRRETFDYEYLIHSERLANKRPDMFETYNYYSSLEKVAEYKQEQSSLVQFLSLFGVYPLSQEGYNGTIYRRIKK